jgi:hypothetical protein
VVATVQDGFAGTGFADNVGSVRMQRAGLHKMRFDGQIQILDWLRSTAVLIVGE